jgi:hypothetical protein
MDDTITFSQYTHISVFIFIAYDAIFHEAHVLNATRYATLFDVARAYIDTYLFPMLTYRHNVHHTLTYGISPFH